MEHSKTLSPSSAPALNICASFQSDNTPSEAKGDDTLGVHLHSLLELFAKNDGEPDSYDKGNASQHDISGIIWSLNFIKEKIAENVNAHPEDINTKEMYEDGSLLIESKVQIFGRSGIVPMTFGTADFIFTGIFKGENRFDPIVFDYKSGIVQPHFEQLSIYALGYMQLSGHHNTQLFEVFGRYKEYIEDFVTLGEAEDILEETVKRKENPSDYPLATNAYCDFCLNRFSCKAILDPLETIPTVNFDLSKKVPILQALSDATMGSEDTTPEEKKNAINFIDENSSDIMFLYRFASIGEKWCKMVKDSIDNFVKNEDIPIPGITSINTKGSMKVKNPKGMYEASNMGPDRFLSFCKISITDFTDSLSIEEIEDLYGGPDAMPTEFISTRGKSKGRLKQGSKKDAIHKFFAEHLERGEPGKMLKVDRKHELYKAPLR
jgi:hypothetical protein